MPHFQNFIELQPGGIAMLDPKTAKAYTNMLTNYLYVTRGYVHKFVDVGGFIKEHSPAVLPDSAPPPPV